MILLEKICIEVLLFINLVFKLQVVDISDTPIAIAKKVAHKLFEKHSRVKKITFCIRETTKDSKKKLYHYYAEKKRTDAKLKVFTMKG